MRSELSLRTLRQHPMLLAAAVLTIGVLAILAPHGRSATPSASLPVKRAMPTVLAASHTLSAGSVIGPADTELKPAAGSVPADAALSEADALGRVIAKGYAAKETILRGDLRDSSTLGIAARVLRGQRAFSIHIGEDDIVGGFLQSGDHVDVFATIPGSVFPSKNSGDVPDRSRAVLLLQDVLVLAVGENPATHGSIQSAARTVSLSLSPEELARLALAQRYGKVSLAIRLPGDTSTVRPVFAALADIVPSAAEASEHSSTHKRKASSGILFYSGARTTSLSWGGSR